jgi:ArsR family transcriptional regulator
MDSGHTALKLLKALSDPTRLRLIALLHENELSVNELQEITRLGQSRISTHLRLLQEIGVLKSRRDGKRTFYRWNESVCSERRHYMQLAVQAAKELPEYESDSANLRRILELRENRIQLFFNQVAGRFGRVYGPGRSWQAFGHLLLRILPPIVVADLGSGEGLISELLAKRCKKVIAVDNSEKIVRFGKEKAKKNGIKNLEFRLGDLQDPPIESNSVDLVILSQALHHAQDPQKALNSSFRILKPNGQVIILDLRKHDFEKAHEMFGDLWLGFSEHELHSWFKNAGFINIEISVVDREPQPPHFETILAAGEKPAA